MSLYWAIQWRRNEGLGALFLVLAGFLVLYAILFPGILSIGGAGRFVQNWFPMALVAVAQAIVMLTGGIDLSVGAMVGLGSVVAATTMTGAVNVPLSVCATAPPPGAAASRVTGVANRTSAPRPVPLSPRTPRRRVSGGGRGSLHTTWTASTPAQAA